MHSSSRRRRCKQWHHWCADACRNAHGHRRVWSNRALQSCQGSFITRAAPRRHVQASRRPEEAGECVTVVCVVCIHGTSTSACFSWHAIPQSARLGADSSACSGTDSVSEQHHCHKIRSCGVRACMCVHTMCMQYMASRPPTCMCCSSSTASTGATLTCRWPPACRLSLRVSVTSLAPQTTIHLHDTD
jgi:hypothetical protein